MQLATVPGSHQRFKFAFPSYPFCGYSEQFVFPFSLVGVLLFLPHQTGIHQETIFLASNTYTASFLSVFIISMTLERLL